MANFRIETTPSSGATAPSGRADRSVGAGRRPRGLPRSGPGSGSGSRRPAPQTPATTLLPSTPWSDYEGGGHWTLAHRRWLARESFEHPAQQIVFQEKIDAIEDAAQRLRRLDEQLGAIVPTWSMARVVEAYQAMRGASFLVAVIFAAEIGDVRRFDSPPQLMAFLGLVPGERSTGDTVHRSSLTLAGNRRARRALVEAAWTYRYPARVSETLRVRLEGLPKAVRDIAWKAQVRLAPAIVASVPAARSRRWSWPRSRERWQPSCGPSAGRSHRRSGVNSTRCTALGVGPRWGTPVASYVAEPIRPTPAL